VICPKCAGIMGKKEGRNKGYIKENYIHEPPPKRY
jgi:hypothetical protein